MGAKYGESHLNFSAHSFTAELDYTMDLKIDDNRKIRCEYTGNFKKQHWCCFPPSTNELLLKIFTVVVCFEVQPGAC